MRVLQVTPFYDPAPAYGGTARAATGLCRALVGRGHEVVVATALLDPSVPREAVEAGVRVHRFSGPLAFERRLFPLAYGLPRFLHSELPRADILHLHGARNALVWAAARLARNRGVPYVLQTHGTFPHHGQRRLLKRIFDRAGGRRVVADAAALIAVSAAEARDLPRPARVIPNGVEMPSCPRPPRAARARMLFVGSDRPQKRARMLGEVLSAFPEIELELVGPIARGFVRALGGGSARVRPLGVLGEQALAAAYAAADLLVHPAVGEAFGLAAFEAALMGTPGVVADGHGCGEWYGKAGGCVVPPDDVPSLLQAIAARLRDPELGRAEAARVAAYARRALTWDRAASAAEDLYDSIVRAPGRGAA